jgi:hypothetical protein
MYRPVLKLFLSDMFSCPILASFFLWSACLYCLRALYFCLPHPPPHTFLPVCPNFLFHIYFMLVLYSIVHDLSLNACLPYNALQTRSDLCIPRNVTARTIIIIFSRHALLMRDR